MEVEENLFKDVPKDEMLKTLGSFDAGSYVSEADHYRHN